MTTYTKSLIQAIMSIGLPEDVLDKIKEYTFPKKISKNDERYNILSKIPQKIYDIEDNVTYVYLNINQDKDYFLTYKNLEIQIQTLLYTDENTIYGTSAHIISIE